ncbi:MAG: enoyl-CoA hydratase/isomerase family protein [Deltaproteobacteria bacterium]|nr:enoyl-CoA hydratase/isomerase family protein [Deltaproteobacteria bacterium]
MSELVTTKQEDTIFEIVLNRPDKRNAFSPDLWNAFEAALKEANRATSVRALIIRGEGKSFSAGIDVTSFMLLPEHYGDDWLKRMRTVTDDFQSVLTYLERIELPTIALIHGHCLGLGMELVLACDIRIAAKGTKLGLPETRLGLIPDVGGTTRLTRLIGPGRAKELIFTGKQIDADLAEKWGIVNHVVEQSELHNKGRELVDELKLAAPLAVGMAKRVIDGLSDIDRGLLLEGWAQSQLVPTEDFTEGIQSFVQKRPPEFKGK